MQTRQGNKIQSLIAAEAFLGENSAALGAVATSPALARFSSAMSDVHLHATDQRGSTMKVQGGTKRTQSFRKDLLKFHMRPIARVGRVELPHTHELLPLRAPKANVSNVLLVSAARGMSQVAALHSDVFIGAGLPADFIASLDAATSALVDAITLRSTDQGKQSGATGGLSSALRVARQRLDIVDSLVQVALAGDNALLTNWNRVKRIIRTRSRSSTDTTQATPVATSPVAAAA